MRTEFSKLQKIRFARFIISSDFGCALIHSTDNISFGLNTRKYQGHIVSSYGSNLICVNLIVNHTKLTLVNNLWKSF